MKKAIGILLCGILAMSLAIPATGFAENEQEDYQAETFSENVSSGDYTYTQSDGEITITKYAGSGETVEIPSQIEGMPVTTIGRRAFQNCSTIIQLTIPDGITFIDREAFRDCTNLEEIYYNCTLEKIGTNIFSGCSKLKTAYLGENVASLGVDENNTTFGPAMESFVVDEKNQKLFSMDGVLYQVQEDGKDAVVLYPVAKKQESFHISDTISGISRYGLCGNPYLKELMIEGEDLVVKQNAICNLSSLEKITIGGKIDSMDTNAIVDCDALQEIYVEVNIPSPKSGSGFFSGCANLSYVRIGKNVTEFSADDFGDTISFYDVEDGNTSFLSDNGVLYSVKDIKTLLKYPPYKEESSYVIPGDTGKIEGRAFEECTLLKEVIFSPQEEVEIETYTFYRCGELERIELTGNVTKVNDDAIWGCDNLHTILWGERLTEWGDISNLSGFSGLQEVQVESGNTKFSSSEGVLFDKEQKILYVYPASKEGGTYVVPSTVTEIYEYAFQNCIYLNAIEIPESVTAIGDHSIDCTIIGIKGSEAEKYALEQGLPFIDKNQEETIGYPVIPDSESSVWETGQTEEITPEGNMYIVNNAAQLAWIAAQTMEGNDFSGKEIVLAADVDLEANEWMPIGDNENPFRGNFDGRNHKIKNLKITESTYAGLFGGISSKAATQTVHIRNINLVNAEISGATSAGALAGYVRSYKGAGVRIESITVSGSIEGKEAGGAIGFVQGGENGAEITIENIRSTCDVQSSEHGAGIIGRITSGDDRYESYNGTVTVADCRFNGTVTAPQRNGNSGGIVGEAEAVFNGKLEIRHCRTDGKIATENTGYVGGIAARLTGSNAWIISCVNYAYITDHGYYGGGIAGRSSGKIEQCYNGGNVIAVNQGSVYGGIVGYHDKEGIIKDSYNLGSIIGISNRYTYPGGITGNNYGKLENCYHAGSLPEQGSSILTQCYPGAMGSVVEGAAEYCYYDAIAFDIGHLYGKPSQNPDTPLVYDDLSKGIVHSGGMTTEEMKKADSYGPWDFSSVWEFDHEYSWGYPTLISVKDLLDKQPDSDKKQVKDKNGKFTLTVVDEENNKIEGAVITLGDVTQETGESGQAKFDYTEEALTLNAEKEGYLSYGPRTYTMNPKREDMIRMIKEENADAHPLNSVIMDMRGNQYELLTQTKTINRKYAGVEFKIYCVPSNLQTEYVKYEIMQGDYAAAESSTGEFTLTPDIFETTEQNKVVRETKIRLTDTAGKTSEEKINLLVVDEQEMETSLEFGQGISFEVGENVPVFGGSTIKFDAFELPVSVKISEEKWRVTLNMLDGNWDGTEEDGVKVLKSEFSLEKKLEKVKKYLKNESVLCQNPKISFELVGYAEGDMPMGSNDIDMKIYGKLIAKFGKEAQVSVFVFAIDVKGEITATGELVLNKETLQITDGNFKVGTSLGMGVYAGVGMANVLSVGIYGDPKIGVEYYLLPTKEAGLDEFYLSGSVKLVLRFLGTNAETYKLWGPGKVWMYSRDLDEYQMEEEGDLEYQTAAQWLASLGEEPIEIVEEKSAGEWTGGNAVVQEEAYAESEPVFMQAEGDLIMLFTSNMVTGRNAADASVLMYSVYDASNNQWLEPKPVDDDGTADFNPAAAGKYIVWNNSKSSLANCTTLDQRGQLQEVNVAVYDSSTQSFTDVQTLTSNQSFENDLNIQETDHGVSISWSINDQNDVFGMEGENTLYLCSQKGDEWITQEIERTNHVVVGKTAGELDGRPYVAYIVDEDDNLTNQEGQAAYLVFSDTGEKQRLTEKNVNAIYSLSSQNKMIIIDTEGNIYSKSGENGEIQQETEEGIVTGRVQQIIEDGRGNLSILFIQNAENNANAYVVQYDSETSRWSDVLEATDSEHYVEHISGGYVDGKLILLYNQREIDVEASDLNGKNSLMWNSVETGTVQLSDVEVNFYKQDAAGGEELPLEITMKNTGFSTCRNVDIAISDETGLILSQTIQTEILPGEEKTIAFSITVPQLDDKKEYQLTINPADDKENTVSTEFVLGEANLQLDKSLYCVDGTYTLVATVTNKGAQKGKGTIEIFDFDHPETIYESFTFTELAGDEVLHYDTAIDNLNWEEVSYKKIGIRIVADGEQVGDIRTVDIYTDYQIPVEEVYINATSVELEEIGQTYRLIASVLPEAAASMGVLWQSGNESVVTVNSSGVITAVGEGETTVSAAIGDKTAVCKIVVKGAAEIVGDINQDGNINLVDLMQCLNHVGRKELLEGKTLETADINGDGAVNLVDLMRLLNYVGRKSSVL